MNLPFQRLKPDVFVNAIHWPKVALPCIFNPKWTSNTFNNIQFSDYKYGKCSRSPVDDHNSDTISSSSLMPTDKSFARSSPMSASACYRTFFSTVGEEGCPNRKTSAHSRLCCELRFRPYNGQSYTALRLDVPSRTASLQYTVNLKPLHFYQNPRNIV